MRGNGKLAMFVRGMQQSKELRRLKRDTRVIGLWNYGVYVCLPSIRRVRHLAGGVHCLSFFLSLSVSSVSSHSNDFSSKLTCCVVSLYLSVFVVVPQKHSSSIFCTVPWLHFRMYSYHLPQWQEQLETETVAYTKVWRASGQVTFL